MNVRAIRTENDRAWAMGEIERLWDRVEPGTPQGDRFEVLLTLVDAYEREHFPVPPPDPIDAILFRLEQEGLAKRDLLPIFKTTGRMSEILNRKRRMSLDMIRALSERFGIPMDVLAQNYRLKTSSVRRGVVRATKRRHEARVA
jgi:HTH-type transcriptional regulator/antitoxin HigA